MSWNSFIYRGLFGDRTSRLLRKMILVFSSTFEYWYSFRPFLSQWDSANAFWMSWLSLQASQLCVLYPLFNSGSSEYVRKALFWIGANGVSSDQPAFSVSFSIFSFIFTLHHFPKMKFILSSFSLFPLTSKRSLTFSRVVVMLQNIS